MEEGTTDGHVIAAVMDTTHVRPTVEDDVMRVPPCHYEGVDRPSAVPKGTTRRTSGGEKTLPRGEARPREGPVRTSWTRMCWYPPAR